MSDAMLEHLSGPATAIRRATVIARADKLRKRDRRELVTALRELAEKVSVVQIDRGKAAKRAAKRARRDGADVVVVAGGDGTVRAAAEGLVGSGVPLAVVPAGTANLFASALDLPTRPRDIVELIASGARCQLDTGVCNGRTFNVMAGAGFDAAMIADADAAKERLGMFAYLRAGAREARRRQPFPMTVEVDGELAFEGAATGILVANVGALAGGLDAFPDWSVTDGKLDVAVLSAAGRLEWASLMLAAARHRQQLSAHADLLRAERVTVRFPVEHRFELDGGSKGRASGLDLEVRPASLTLCARTVR